MTTFEKKWPNALLLPFSLIYAAIIHLRNWLYDNDILSRTSVPCKVISIGNLTVGGTGKTPTVAMVAEEMSRNQFSVCVVSRGYKRTTKGTLLVSNGTDVLAGADECGDEPFLLARSLNGIPVIVDENRVRGAQYAIQTFCPDVILLDDAFQHRRINRDVDVVLVDASAGFGNKWLLPAGPLREPLRALRRASVIIFTRVEQNLKLPALKELIARSSSAPICAANHIPVVIKDLDGREISIEAIKGRKVFAFCGIGKPASFFSLLEQLGAELIDVRIFKDHHPYSAEDKKNLVGAAREGGAEMLITTEKDRVRLSPEYFSLPLWTLKIKMVLQYGADEFWNVCGISSNTS